MEEVAYVYQTNNSREPLNLNTSNRLTLYGEKTVRAIETGYRGQRESATRSGYGTLPFFESIEAATKFLLSERAAGRLWMNLLLEVPVEEVRGLLWCGRPLYTWHRQTGEVKAP